MSFVPKMLMEEMPFDKFILEFLSGGQGLTDEEYEEVGDFSLLDKALRGIGEPAMTQEKHMYPHICQVLNKVISLKSGGSFVYKDTADWPESSILDSNPDGCIYATSTQATGSWQLTMNELEKTSKYRRPHAARVAWAFAEVVFEIKLGLATSAFDLSSNEGDPVLWDTKAAEAAQFIKYATEALLRQHRQFLFEVYIADMNARLIRWDRAGAVVSSNIDLRNMSREFLNIISRMVTMTPVERGHDETATFATAPQIQELERFTHATPYGQKLVRDILENKKIFPIHQVRCPVIDESVVGESPTFPPPAPPSRIFLIGIPTAGSYSPTGRATRGYVAYDVDKQRLVFLKDSWRPDSPGVRPELDIYMKLHSSGVTRYVATAIGGGDVGAPHAQTTRNDQWLKQAGRAPTTRIHHRILTSRIGRPLDTYETSTELMCVVADALRGHCEAFQKAKILHRDVSVNNILIDIAPEGTGRARGFINDWDSSKYISDSDEATQQGRSGTWAFLSALLGRFPRRSNSLSDDLESFVYVITFLTLRFHRHNLSPISCRTLPYNEAAIRTENSRNKHLADLKYGLFDAEYEEHGYHVGGDKKFECIRVGNPGFSLVEDAKTGVLPLAKLLSSLYRLLQEHYTSYHVFDVGHPVEAVALPRRPNTHFVGSGENRIPDDHTRTRTTSTPLASAMIPTSTISPSTHRPVLDKHSYMLDEFEKILYDIGQSDEEILDKTPDQFRGLGWYQRIQSSTGRSGASRYHARLPPSMSNLGADEPLDASAPSTSVTIVTADHTVSVRIPDHQSPTGHKRKSTSGDSGPKPRRKRRHTGKARRSIAESDGAGDFE